MNNKVPSLFIPIRHHYKMFAIDTHHLRKEYGKKVAVSDLTLQVQQGEVFGFLGPNGAGKTTSLKMLLGLITPSSGKGTLLGKPLGDRQARAKVGYLPEHFRFHEWLKAGEFLDLHGKLYGMSAAERGTVIPDLLDLVGLAEQVNVKVGTFSKGMQQRIGLAQALLNSPQIVFLDEPTSGLDPLGRRLVRDIILQLREEKVTVFLNSHLLSEVELTCDRVAFIRKGEVVETTTLAQLQQQQIQLTVRVGQMGGELPALLTQFGQVMPASPADQLLGRIHLTLNHEEQIPQLAHWLTSNGYNLYELSPTRFSLEERFMQLMGNESLT